ncbi:MAG: GNAT family N-acetyltransferase [Terracidiphilus sp.]|nr:GNAT family N-acetyltransferase [Terracidiphilus sp.]
MDLSFARRAPEIIQTKRLTLRRPCINDADAIFRRYASDPEVTRYLSWRTHRQLSDTRAYLIWSDHEWARWPSGPFLVLTREPEEHLIGGTGLAFQSAEVANTGYALARDAWGHGYATECLQAMIELARMLGVRTLKSTCHVEHSASAHVMEKCGMRRERVAQEDTEFPNIAPGVRLAVLRYHLELTT